jgi:diguanylate cyclase (GGDEF)-like protein
MKTVVVITRDVVLTSIVERLVKDLYKVLFFPTVQSSLDYIYNSVPDVLVAYMDADPRAVTLVNELKSDPIFGHLPFLAIFPDDVTLPVWESLLADDYLRKHRVVEEILSRVDLCIQRAERMVEVNPLTRLPGNITISKQIQKRLDSGELFALAYADLDYFKPFNDRYGFSRGDEVLKMTGRLVLNTVKEKQPHGSFVGHIGGDDFIFMMDYDLIESTALLVGENFDRIIPTFYDSEDRALGHIASEDREGNKRTFPFIGISTGVAHNKYRSFSHYGEMAEAASEMKKYAKTVKGSYCKMDKRYCPEPTQKA